MYLLDEFYLLNFVWTLFPMTLCVLNFAIVGVCAEKSKGSVTKHMLRRVDHNNQYLNE